MHTPALDLEAGRRDDELVATVALLQAQILPPERIAAILDHVGSAVEVARASLSGSALPDASQLVSGAITTEVLLEAGQTVAAWRAAGFDARTVLDPDYPANLQAVFDKPPLLFIAGHWDEARDSRAVAVVGTRSPSRSGLLRAARLSRDLVRAGFTVVSGLARGIDTAAHIAALRERGRTVAVMGTGVLKRYPRSNAKLADAILEAKGALLSQFFPEQPPTRWTFPKRNVVMSGLTLATVVIEAGATSGAKMQAEAALRHGRSVFLPSSLVAVHSWARQLVTDGFQGARAIEVASTDELVQRLDLALPNLPSVTV